MPEIDEIKNLSSELFEKEKDIILKNHIKDKNLSNLFYKLYISQNPLEKEEKMTIFLSELLKYNHENLKILNIDKKISNSIDFIHINIS